MPISLTAAAVKSLTVNLVSRAVDGTVEHTFSNGAVETKTYTSIPGAGIIADDGSSVSVLALCLAIQTGLGPDAPTVTIATPPAPAVVTP